MHSTLHNFLQKNHAHSADLNHLIEKIGLACIKINHLVNRAGISDILGEAGETNIQGEDVKKLDLISNDILKDILAKTDSCAGLASEEEDDIVCLNTDGQYVVCFDPLDGSSNIDYNIPIGTIFAIYKRVTETGDCTEADFLQPGKKLVAAGYALYGSSSMLVLSLGKGTHGFFLNPDSEEFILTNENIRLPQKANTYSLNQGNIKTFPQFVQDFVHWAADKEKETQRPYSLRYVGSMVADVHRNLLKGGLFIYPETESAPNGKLRLLYECNPMTFLVEQAGGEGTTGEMNILDIQPSELHQRVPIYLGPKDMVSVLAQFKTNHV